MEENEIIDKKDIKIIEILSANARSPLRDIAKEVGLSPSSVRNRMQRLLDLGVVRKYTLDVNHRMTGLSIEVIALLSVKLGAADDIERRLLELSEVSNLVRTAGRISFVCTLRFHSIDDLSGFMIEKLERLDGIEHIETLLVIPRRVEIDSGRPADGERQ